MLVLLCLQRGSIAAICKRLCQRSGSYTVPPSLLYARGARNCLSSKQMPIITIHRAAYATSVLALQPLSISPRAAGAHLL
jgi:hypothetical protein